MCWRYQLSSTSDNCHRHVLLSLRGCECAYPRRTEAALRQLSGSCLLRRPAWGGILSQDKVGEVYTISKQVMPKFGGATKLVGNSLSCIHPLQGTAFRKGFIAKLPAARCGNTAEQLAASKCIVSNANYRCRQLDDSKLSTTLPCFCTHKSDAWLYADMT